MNRRFLSLAMMPALLLLLVVGRPARAAQSFEGCDGFVTSLPATISTPGVWCLRQDLSTAMTSGNAITVAADDVTIDCNHYKLGGLGAGPATTAYGIRADADYVTVRQCNVRGFRTGILLDGSGHRVERNRFDANTSTAVVLSGNDGIIRGNTVHDTGGLPGSAYATAISAWGNDFQIDGNDIDGVHPAGDVGGNRTSTGIQTGTGGILQRNRISNLSATGEGQAIGIWMDGGMVVDNQLLQPVATPGVGISAHDAGNFAPACHGNLVKGYAQMATGCGSGSNVHQP